MENGPSPARIPFETLSTRTVRADGKLFDLALRKNRRGAYVVVTEHANGRTNNVVIPAPSLREMISEFQRLAIVAGV
jgi:hypothetical protein